VLIAVAAVFFLKSSEQLTFGRASMGTYHWLIFFGSLFVYGAHRLVGLHRLQAHRVDDRHEVVRRYEWLVLGLTIAGLIGGIFFFFGLSRMRQTLLLFPAVIVMAYIIPITPGGRRLRDFPFVKLFLIALVWAWLGTIVLLWEENIPGLWWLFGERLFYILAITLPFDIRDMELDRAQHTKTIPQLLGVTMSKTLSYLLMSVALFLGLVYISVFSLRYEMLPGYIASVLMVFYLLQQVSIERSDYLYRGWLDSTMIVQYVLLLALAKTDLVQ